MKSKPDPPVFRQPGRYSERTAFGQEFSTVKIPKDIQMRFCVFLLLYWIHKAKGLIVRMALALSKNSWQNWIKRYPCSSCPKAWSRKKNYAASWLFFTTDELETDKPDARQVILESNGTLRRQLAGRSSEKWHMIPETCQLDYHHVRGMFQCKRRY